MKNSSSASQRPGPFGLRTFGFLSDFGFRFSDLSLILLTLACCRLSAASPQLDAPITPPDPVAAGRELVARLLALRPAESTTNDAVLHVLVSKTNQFVVPLKIEVSITASNWSTTYSARSNRVNEILEFTITHTPGEQNQYCVTRYPTSFRPDGCGRSDPFVGEMTFIPFAGSDFWLADLGMEFLHWPTQRLLKKELCRGQSCDKLESIAPEGWTNGYLRVVSWFDIDTGGPVLVEAYDAKGRVVKEFKPNDFKKVNGQWQVEELEMNNRRTGSRTTLRFQLDAR